MPRNLVILNIDIKVKNCLVKQRPILTSIYDLCGAVLGTLLSVISKINTGSQRYEASRKALKNWDCLRAQQITGEEFSVG